MYIFLELILQDSVYLRLPVLHQNFLIFEDNTGTNGLGISLVKGSNLDPTPAAITIAFLINYILPQTF